MKRCAWPSEGRRILVPAWALFFALFVSFVSLLGALPACAVPVLNLEDCLRLADENSPTLAGAEAQRDSARGLLSQSAVADRVTLSGTVTAERSGRGGEEGASYSAGVSAGLKIFDSNRNRYRIEARRQNLSKADADAENTLLSVHAAVKQAYAALLLKLRTQEHREQSVMAHEQRLEQAQGFYDAGSKPWYDVTKARVDLGNAQLALVEAQGSVSLAKKELLNAMGIKRDEDFSVVPVSFDVPSELLASAPSLALENRPDYRASELSLLGGEASLKAEARGSSPTLSLSGGYSASGSQAFDLTQGWNAGLKMTVPVVDGGEVKAGVAVACAQVRSLEASREQLRQKILLEVGKALVSLENAREQVRISGLTLESAEENCRIAEGRYETGVGAPLEVTDALLNLTEARLAAESAHYALHTAVIELERAVGLEFHGLSSSDRAPAKTPEAWRLP
ncbi:MAG: TolC family protein [Fretibacterium sp.]|nr:TolC family protein [Fretibacterium sp.]